LADQMRGVELADTIQLDTAESPANKKRTKVDELAEWLVTHRGMHTKQKVCDALGIRDTSNLARLLKHDKIQRLCLAGKVRISNKYIEVA
jgi:hypothetical protein